MNWFLGILSSAIAIYFLLCLVLWWGQNRLIFLPSKRLERTPAQVGLPYEDVFIPVLTWQGKLAQLHGWWLPHPTSSEVALHLHGNSYNISVNLGAARTLYEAGFSVLMIDYRGYGRSKGAFPRESEVYRDTQAAWKYLVKTREIAPQNIFIYGHSLGGAIAIDLAVRQPQAAGVIVDSTFTSIAEVAKSRRLYNLFPVDLIVHQRFDSLAKLSLLKVPLFVIHGTEDRKVPTYLGEKLFAAANVPKKLFLVPYADHENTTSAAEGNYTKALRDFKSFVRAQPQATSR
jgi:pimeloyl-ACP methyl ester carboxylesterase